MRSRIPIFQFIPKDINNGAEQAPVSPQPKPKIIPPPKFAFH